jgi:hypothetical protein
MAIGTCSCGAVAFEIGTNPSGVCVCHRSICRRAAGSHGMAVVVVNNADFRWRRGEGRISACKKPGTDSQTGFCSTCGSPLPGINDESRMFVPAGLITDGGDHLTVIHHIRVDSKAPWNVIGEPGEQHANAIDP